MNNVINFLIKIVKQLINLKIFKKNFFEISLDLTKVFQKTLGIKISYNSNNEENYDLNSPIFKFLKNNKHNIIPLLKILLKYSLYGGMDTSIIFFEFFIEEFKDVLYFTDGYKRGYFTVDAFETLINDLFIVEEDLEKDVIVNEDPDEPDVVDNEDDN